MHSNFRVNLQCIGLNIMGNILPCAVKQSIETPVGMNTVSHRRPNNNGIVCSHSIIRFHKLDTDRSSADYMTEYEKPRSSEANYGQSFEMQWRSKTQEGWRGNCHSLYLYFRAPIIEYSSTRHASSRICGYFQNSRNVQYTNIHHQKGRQIPQRVT